MTADVRRYEISGAVLRSEVELKALATRAAGGTADPRRTTVDFRMTAEASAPAPLAGRVVHTEPHVEIIELEAGFVARAHGHADFAFDRAGQAIVCTPLAGVALDTVEQLLLDQILPKVLQLHGQTCLHASAIVVDGAVIAFLGHSGSGKSTLAASFASERAVISDDCLAVDLEPGSPRVLAHPSYASLRLCHDAARALDRANEGAGEVSARMSWKVRVPFDAPPDAVFHVRAAYMLDGTEGPLAIAPLSQRDAYMAFANYTHRFDPTNPVSLAREVTELRELAVRVPVARLTYPRRFEDLADVRAAIEADVRLRVRL